VIAYLKPYSEMKDSGVESVGGVPKHWEVRQLRHAAELRVSNVDKHTIDGELSVRLCNYVDVYRHERIQTNMPFMAATATAEEIERFRIEIGDVLLTKDSESWTDIGVPALVVETARDLVCAYHLAILRPPEGKLLAGYLFRAVQSNAVAYQFHIGANGVTRHGLSHAAIKSVRLPVPPLPEQAAIVRFLDHADQRIRRYVGAKQELIALLTEQKEAIVHEAVKRGVDPAVRLAASGVEWLGDVPEHWKVARAKWFFREVDERSTSGDEELLSVSHLTGVTPRSEKSVTMFKAESYVGHKQCVPGDLVVNTMWAWMGALAMSRNAGLVSPSYAVYRSRWPRHLIDGYADLLLRTRMYVNEYVRRSTGIRSSRLRLYPDAFLRIPLLCPPVEDQQAIVEYVSSATASADRAIAVAGHEIALLQEYRTRLIDDVVTGKLDVRDAAAGLPAEFEPLDEGADQDLDEAEDDLDPEMEEIEA
jgi:type I restriction enzyme, S subunit